MSSAGLVSILPVLEESMTFLPPEHSQESILLFVAMPGSKVPIRVLESDSIESVKVRIQSCKGIFRRNQKLVCGGRELARSKSLVRDYGLSDGNVVHLLLRLKDLQVIKVRTCCGKEFEFQVEKCRDVGYVKRQIAERESKLTEDHEVLLNGKPIEDQRLINDISKDDTDAVIRLFVRKSAKIRGSPVGKNFELSIVAPQQKDVVSERKADPYVPRKAPERESVLDPIIINPKTELPLEINHMIDATRKGLEQADEEPLAENNPRGLPLSEDGEGLKKGTRVGEGALRECAVFLLDHPKSGNRSFSGEIRGFAGVPPTVYVKCLHEGFNHPGGVSVKTGSLQMFMENNGSCEDMGPGAFPVEEVHKIAVLDMRMANADRHAGNILVSKGEDGQTVLIPIDHGYCLPYTFQDCTFDWLYWPQARQPFGMDTLEYIRSMDAEMDIALLKFYGWELPNECARVLRISTMLLKKGAEKGLTPFVIGNMMCRETVRKISVIEEIVEEALDSVLPGSSEGTFLDCVSSIMGRRLEEYK
ncbi:phosphatidylinositol 4-kinase gamma 4-like [Salvia divinorum]|uniref:1-phosphatidylinositol 4-kinase n=1 Tax=Salvia divinorum TaxID=28513 RepID=A0ABD1GTL9_SALDI